MMPRTFLGASLLMLCVGCLKGEPMHVHSYWDPGAPLSGVGTSFAWAEKIDGGSGSPSFGNPNLDRLVNELIAAKLDHKGYREASSDKADFAVAHYVGKRVRMGSGNDWWDEAGLVIEVSSPETDKLIWRGWAETRIDYSLSPEVRRARIETAVNRILDQFLERSSHGRWRSQ